MDRRFQRILIVRTDRIGDVILTLPMAHVLKINFPNVNIAMLIQRYTAELVEDNRNVDQILFYDNDKNKPIPFLHFISSLKREKFDVVFHTHPRFRLALITWLADIPFRVGTGYRWYSFLFNKKVYEHRKDAKHHELEFNLNLLTAIGCSIERDWIVPYIEVRQETTNSINRFLLDLEVRQENRLVILHPGSGKSARDWNPKNFGLLGKQLSKLPNVKVIITGGKGDQKLIEEVKSICGEGVVALVNRFSLREYGALAKMASLFIANSTGPIHIAAAVGTPVIGLYPQVTSLSAARWGPYTENKTIFSPRNKPIDCKKCLHRNDNICECMDSITVDEVYEAAIKYLSSKDSKEYSFLNAFDK